MLDLGYPLCMGNGMLCYDERHPLLMKCFITFLRCISKAGRAYGIITLPLIVHTLLFLSRSNLKLHTKYQILGTVSISTESGMLWCQDRHPLLLKYLTIFSPCMRNASFQVVYGLGELLKAFISHLWVTMCDFSYVDSQGTNKIPDLEYPLNRRKGVICCNERHSLLLKYFISFLRCMSNVKGAFDRT